MSAYEPCSACRGFRYYECVSGYVETNQWHVWGSGDTR